MEQDDETRNLADQNGLVTVGGHFPAKEEKKRSAGAIRVARHRQKKKEMGLAQADIPVRIVEEIKAAGSFEAWMSDLHRQTPEKVEEINHAMEIMKKVEKLPRWVRLLLKF